MGPTAWSSLPPPRTKPPPPPPSPPPRPPAPARPPSPRVRKPPAPSAPASFSPSPARPPLPPGSDRRDRVDLHKRVPRQLGHLHRRARRGELHEVTPILFVPPPQVIHILEEHRAPHDAVER